VTQRVTASVTDVIDISLEGKNTKITPLILYQLISVNIYQITNTKSFIFISIQIIYYIYYTIYNYINISQLRVTDEKSLPVTAKSL
jgi:hypothetical protein